MNLWNVEYRDERNHRVLCTCGTEEEATERRKQYITQNKYPPEKVRIQKIFGSTGHMEKEYEELLGGS